MLAVAFAPSAWSLFAAAAPVRSSRGWDVLLPRSLGNGAFCGVFVTQSDKQTLREGGRKNDMGFVVCA